MEIGKGSISSSRAAQLVKVVFTGPESTGKTALAEALSNTLGIPWVPEFARYYVAHLGRPYERTDLTHIGRGQRAWEQWVAQRIPPILICDTDWTVLQIWEHYRYGKSPNGFWYWREGYGIPCLADLYFLCAPDFPWQPDPLREHPYEREELFTWYEQLLQTHAASYEILKGTLEKRLSHALRGIERLKAFSNIIRTTEGEQQMHL